MHLLTLPRELRDMIIDDVLRSLYPAPVPSSHHRVDSKRTRQPEAISIPRMLPFYSVLFYINAQLRAETMQRASKLDLPVVLDVLLVDDGHVKVSWRGRPWKDESCWDKIRMVVQVRTQPVSVKLWNAREVREMNRKDAEYTEYYGHYVWFVMTLNVAEAIVRAVMSILSEETRDSAEKADMRSDGSHDDDPRRKNRPPNSIADLQITILPAVDREGIEVQRPVDANPSMWYMPRLGVNGFARGVIDHLEHCWIDSGRLWRYGELVRGPHFLLLTHVGDVQVRFNDRQEDRVHSFWDEHKVLKDGIREDLWDDLGDKYGSRYDLSGLRTIKRQRAQLGWNDAGLGDKSLTMCGSRLR
jgi:hypothetical protein